jgi:hypothetical protein
MQDIIAKLETIKDDSTEAALLDIITKIAANRDDANLKKHFREQLNRESILNICAINALAAGMYGICLGGCYLTAEHEGSYRVHPFLHNLRKAMLACPALREKVRENSRKYAFFPEFNESVPNTRQRIAAIAKAHVGTDMGNDLLTVFFSLGGYFSKSESEVGLRDAKRAGGTTCIMTARAAYHSAGLEMIGERVPSVGAPGGAQLELGVPAQKTADSGKKETKATMLRADQYDFGGNGFNDDNSQIRPQLDVGDIYFVDGDGQFKFLLRPGALAVHVGIVVGNHAGMFVDTIDGGAGSGAKIELRLKRAVRFSNPIGWTLDNPGKSFTTGNIAEVDTYMQGYKDESAVINWLRQNPLAGKSILASIEKFDRDLVTLASQPLLVKQLVKGRASMVEAGRNLIRQVKKDSKSLGQERVLKGWWKPDRYTPMSYCGREQVKGWLGA